MKSWAIRVGFLALLLILVLYLPGCGEKDLFPTFGEPEITSIDPVSRPAGFSDFDLTVRGTGFVTSSLISFDGGDIAPAFISDTELVARVPRSFFLSDKKVDVFVRNPEIAGGQSNKFSFTVRELSFPALGSNLSNSPAVDSSTPAVAVDHADGIHVVWDENQTLRYRKSSDGGNTFSAVTSPLSPTGGSATPVLMTDNTGVLHAVWDDVFDIFYSRSEDDGATFSAGLNVSNTPLTASTGFSATPAVAVNKAGHILMVWEEDFDILFSRSTDMGASFQPPINLSNTPALPPGAPTSGISFTPAIAVDDLGKIHVVWEEDFEILYSRSADGGFSFNPAVNLSGTTIPPSFDSGFSLTPDIAVAGLNNIHVYWEEDFKVLTRRSFDGGGSFDTDFSVSGSSPCCLLPTTAVDPNGNILVAWDDLFDIVFFRSTDQGETFIGQGFLTLGAPENSSPALAADLAGNAYVVWEQDPQGIPEVMFLKGD